MSGVAEKDFSNFELGDDVYRLADGLIPEVAGRLGLLVDEKPNSEHLHSLVGMVGKNKVLRDNEPVTAIELEDAAELVERSGVQKPLDRSLWTPGLQVADSQSGYSGMTIVTGAVANWQDRTAKLVSEGMKAGTVPKRTQVITGNRVMDSATEQANPNIQKFFEEAGRYPTEGEYAFSFVVPVIAEAGGWISRTSYETKDGGEIAANFVGKHKQLFEAGSPIVFARVANAGIQLAAQFRDAIREHANPEFDTDSDSPEAFVVTDSFPVARTEEEFKDPAHFQSPYTGLRQAVLTAKLLHEAA